MTLTPTTHEVFRNFDLIGSEVNVCISRDNQFMQWWAKIRKPNSLLRADRDPIGLFELGVLDHMNPPKSK